MKTKFTSFCIFPVSFAILLKKTSWFDSALDVIDFKTKNFNISPQPTQAVWLKGCLWLRGQSVCRREITKGLVIKMIVAWTDDKDDEGQAR